MAPKVSRISWLNAGDQNTAFFHKMPSMRAQSNCIAKLKKDGEWIRGRANMTTMIEDYYQSLYKEEFWSRPHLEGLDYRRISEEQRDNLERSFTTDEVKEALNNLIDDKALGPDGFPIKFFKMFWEMLESEVIKTLEEFYQNSSLCRSLNASFLVLVPKTKGALELKEFRPLSLLGSFYKILTKVLPRRMELVMKILISRDSGSLCERQTNCGLRSYNKRMRGYVGEKEDRRGYFPSRHGKSL